jgi:hypothetical protein
VPWRVVDNVAPQDYDEYIIKLGEQRMANKKEMVNIARLLVALGFSVQSTGKCHVKITNPERTHFCIISGTPSDPRTLENSIGTIRRELGINLKPLIADKKAMKKALKNAT